MGEFDTYRNYDIGKNDDGKTHIDSYNRTDITSFNGGYDDGSGEFVSNYQADSEIFLSSKQRPKEKTNLGTYRTGFHIKRLPISSINGERIIDIVCTLITIVGLILIAFNFNAVLDAIMHVIYPIIKIVILIIILVVLGVLARLALRRRYSFFRF